MATPNIVWPPSCFPSATWPAGTWPGQFSTASLAPPCDRDVYAEIARRLRATLKIPEVLVAQERDVDRIVAAKGSRVLIVPDSDVRTRRESSPGRTYREASYTLYIKVHGRDQVDESQRVQNLVALAHNVLDGVEYLSYCLFDRCFLDNDAVEYSDPPNFMASVTGRFGYVVDASIGMKVY